MTFKQLFHTKFLFYTIAIISVGFLSACDDDDDGNGNGDASLKTESFDYQFHNGQTVPTAPYSGTHSADLSATLSLKELANGNTDVTVTLNNTIDGQTYHTHAHDGADAASTPNGTPYEESPNADIFAQAIAGNGGTASATQESTRSIDELTADYNGFFVIHDPLQSVSTTDIATFVIVGSFARAQATTSYNSSTFDYAFNTGQLVESFAYAGTHASDLSASITVHELADSRSRVSIQLFNTMTGETYHTHAHDAADAATTANGTPYLETPNADVFASAIAGTGETAAAASISSMSHNEIVSDYSGFFVVHDPLQSVSTTDPTTFVLLGSFAR